MKTKMKNKRNEQIFYGVNRKVCLIDIMFNLKGGLRAGCS